MVNNGNVTDFMVVGPTQWSAKIITLEGMPLVVIMAGGSSH